MTVATVERTAVTAILEADRIEAWDAYLEATRHEGPFTYDEVEPWAWTRLEMTLSAIKAREQALR